MDKTETKISHLLLIVVVFLWGANVGIVKSAFDDVHPILFAALRFTVSGAVLLLFVWWKEKGLRINPIYWRKMAVVGGLGIGVYQIIWSIGLQWTSATNSALIFTIQPLLGAAYVDWTKKESVPRRRYVGMFLALAGVVLVILKPTSEFHFSLETIWGDGLNLAAAICGAVFFTIWPKPLLKVYSPIRVMGHSMLIGSVVLWAGVSLCAQWMPLHPMGEKAWWPLVYAILFGGIIGHSFWYEGIGRIGATKTLFYLYLIPIWAALFNHFYMGEAIFPQQMIGGGLILCGVHYALRD